MIDFASLKGRAISYRRRKYPFNLPGIPRDTELRRMCVSAVRDLESEPLEDDTVTMNPHLDRGRWLVRGYDPDRDEDRSVYIDRADDVRLLVGAEAAQVQKSSMTESEWDAYFRGERPAEVAERFPRLRLAIKSQGDVKVVDLPDPRRYYAVDEEADQPGAVCYPVCSATSRASAKRASL